MCLTPYPGINILYAYARNAPYYYCIPQHRVVVVVWYEYPETANPCGLLFLRRYTIPFKREQKWGAGFFHHQCISTTRQIVGPKHSDSWIRSSIFVTWGNVLADIFFWCFLISKSFIFLSHFVQPFDKSGSAVFATGRRSKYQNERDKAKKERKRVSSFKSDDY